MQQLLRSAAGGLPGKQAPRRFFRTEFKGKTMSASPTLTLLATASIALFNIAAPAAADTSCEVRVVQDQSYTRFPMRSQLRGQQGTVVVDVTLDDKGRATAAKLHRSSGHRLLDRAATRSVLESWQFDVSKCGRDELRGSYLVGVEYRPSDSGTRPTSNPAPGAAQRLPKANTASALEIAAIR